MYIEITSLIPEARLLRSLLRTLWVSNYSVGTGFSADQNDLTLYHQAQKQSEKHSSGISQDHLTRSAGPGANSVDSHVSSRGQKLPYLSAESYRIRDPSCHPHTCGPITHTGYLVSNHGGAFSQMDSRECACVPLPGGKSEEDGRVSQQLGSRILGRDQLQGRPGRSEAEAGMEEEREGTPFSDHIWMHPTVSESLYRPLYVSERDKTIFVLGGFAWVSLKVVLAHVLKIQ